MAKKYLKDGLPWKRFTAMFLDACGKDKDGNWLRIKVESRGQAINRVQQLNGCNMQHHEECGIPLTNSDISARPVQDEAGNWYVTIGPSYTHRTKVADENDPMLKEIKAQSGVAAKPENSDREEEMRKRQVKQDDLIANMFNLNGGNDDVK